MQNCSSNEVSFDADVLIVGLGPVGATLALLCARYNLSVVAIDRARGVHPLPRAAHFDDEIMRVFQSLDLAKALEPHIRSAPDYEFRTADGHVLMCIKAVSETSAGWASGYMVYQPGIERVLRERLADISHIKMMEETAFRSLQQDNTGVTSVLSQADQISSVRSRFVIACDGATSSVRESLGIGLEDLRFEEAWLVVDVRLGSGAHVPNVNLQLCDPSRPTTCVLMGPGRHRWEFMLKPGEEADAALESGFVEELLARWDCGSGHCIERRAVYRFHGLLADRWCERRVFLSGDAAHQMPPFAGQGMCAGIRDAANLAWKVAAVVYSGAHSVILDTYQQEREPHVREVIDLAINMGRVVCTTDRKAAAERDAAMIAAYIRGEAPPRIAFKPLARGLLLENTPGSGELFPQAVVAGTKLDDVLSPSAWLILRGSDAEIGLGPASAIATSLLSPYTLTDPLLKPFASTLKAWLDARGVDAVLIRPDRYIFGSGHALDLQRAFADRLSAAPANARIADPALPF